MPRQEGQFNVEDYYVNDGGLNTADSPFIVRPTQATGGKNYDYLKRGGVQKRAGHQPINTVPDTQVRPLGLGLFDVPGINREVIRAAGTAIQCLNVSGPTFTALSEDTLAASTTPLSGVSTTPVVSSMFNTPSNGALWLAGGGLTNLIGVYSNSKYTQNGVQAPTGAITTGVTTTGGNFPSAGVYKYAVALHKTSTGALSNASFYQPATLANTTDKVTITLSGITGVDTTKHDKFYIYRSALNGADGFTTGDLVATVATSTTSYVDTGTSVSQAQNVPRAGNLVLDNSPLPVTTPIVAVTTFKRRLVTAIGSTVYLSDINKPESFPLANTITVPSGGPITGLAIVSFTSRFSNSLDEHLCVFKQRELWVIKGTNVNDWELKFIDNSGCPSQSLIVGADGYLAWVGYRGVFMWDGSGKARYASQFIEDKFARGGDIDKSKLGMGWGVFSPARNEIQWRLSSTTAGEQQYVLKLDLRLTNKGGTEDGRIDGIFTPDITPFACYAGLVYLPAASSPEESFLVNDGAGFAYYSYLGTLDGAATVDFEYSTANIAMGAPNLAKRFHKVVVWVQDTGPYSLLLDYWANFAFSDLDKSSASQRVSANLQGTGLVWGVGKWGVNYWGTAANRPKPIIFNLTSQGGNAEGDFLRLRLSQKGSTDSLIIYGFSIYYTELTLRK